MRSRKRLPPVAWDPDTPPIDVSRQPDRPIRDRRRSHAPPWSRRHNRSAGDDHRVWNPDVDPNPDPCQSRPSDGNQSTDNERHDDQFRQILFHNRSLLLWLLRLFA